MDNGSIVIVDDNPNNLEVLSGILQHAGYKVRPALGGEIALRAIELNPPDLVLLDIRMPGIDGYETCRRLKADERLRDVPVIFISALSDTEDKLAAFDVGGVDYVSKPFQSAEVLARVRTHVQLRHMQVNLGHLVDERTAELRATCEALAKSRADYRVMLEQTVQAIALTVEKRDPYTAGHQTRVAHLAVAIGTRMGLDPEVMEGLRFGGMIHDIGKIWLPAEILNRPGALTPMEFDLVKSHAEVGWDIVRDINFPWPVAEMIRQHHERPDGSGYPSGLKGDQIIIEARILAVADVVEAMASHRPYRAALGIDRALQELRWGAGKLYDAAIVEACAWLFEEGGYQWPAPSSR